MKAVVQDRYGSPDVLRLEDVDVPVPADNEVLVRVRAASVNARDWHLMRGDPYVARLSADLGLARPRVRIRGTDFAGRVEAVGRAVDRFRPGDEVFGEASGAFAEYVCAPEGPVTRKPANLTFEQAAAVPLAANTALIGLRDAARVQPGQHVLINGASGGVGTFAVQLAKLAGLHVIATTSAANAALVQSLGADEVIDYRSVDVAAKVKDVDLAIDCVGGEAQKALFGTLKKGGLLLSIVSPPDEALATQHGVLARFERGNMNGIRLQEIGGLIDAGKLKVVIDKEFPLAQAKAAHELSESGRARGKIVLRV
jgi:NADPH:quinone reductase-like Zn-dependent oxidoreductase